MTIKRRVKRAIDGDTLETFYKVKGTNFVRITGKDSPERGERGYASAKAKLNRLSGKTVTLIPRGRSYNRVVADVRYKRRKV